MDTPKEVNSQGGRKPYPRKGGYRKPAPPGLSRPNQRFAKDKKIYPPEVVSIAKEHRLPLIIASWIHQGKKTLAEVLQHKAEKEQRTARAREMCAKYPNISMALACLLVKEGMTVEDHAQRQKKRRDRKWEKEMKQKQVMAQDTLQSPAFTYLAHLVAEKTPIVLARYGGEFSEGILQEFTPYDFYFCYPNNVVQKIHRLDLKYVYEKTCEPILKRFVMVDRSIREKKLTPTHSREGRFKFPERVLQDGADISLALHEGEMVRGRIVWFTPYDILLKISQATVLVFRHAVVDCKAMSSVKRL